MKKLLITLVIILINFIIGAVENEVLEFLEKVAEASEKAKKTEDLEKFVFDSLLLDSERQITEGKKEIAKRLFFKSIVIKTITKNFKDYKHKGCVGIFSISFKKHYIVLGLNRDELEEIRKDKCKAFAIANRKHAIINLVKVKNQWFILYTEDIERLI